METYINKDKFQFITEFGKKDSYDGNGNKIQIDFGALTITQRIFLSAYLTMFSSKDELTKNNIYMAVFDFNKEKRHGKKLKALDYEFCDEFMNDFSIFLKEHPEFFLYIKANANTIIDNKTEIKRTQISREEYAVLNSIKVKNNYERFIASLYIIGVAKNKMSTYKLNQISLDYFCPSNKSTAKKYVIDLFENMGYKENQTFRFKDNDVFFKSEFVIEAQDKYASKEKRDFDEINSFLNSKSEEKTVKKEVIEKFVEPVEPVKPIKEEKQDYLYEQIKKSEKQNIPEKDLSDEELDDLFATADAMSGITSINYQMKWQKHKDKIGITPAMKLVQEWNKIFDFNVEVEKIAKKLHTNRDVVAGVMKGGFLTDKEGGIELKKRILQELKELQNFVKILISGVDKSYTIENKEMFEAYVYSNYKELMNL